MAAKYIFPDRSVYYDMFPDSSDDDYTDDDAPPEDIDDNVWTIQFYSEIYKMRENGELDYFTEEEFRNIIEMMNEMRIAHAIHFGIVSECDSDCTEDLSIHGRVTIMIILRSMETKEKGYSYDYDELYEVLTPLVYFHKQNPELTLNEMIDIYVKFRSYGSVRGCKTDIFTLNGPFKIIMTDEVQFAEYLSHWKNVILRQQKVWDLWYENDPAKDIDGIGNLTVWLPKEIVEDVLPVTIYEIQKRKNKRENW